MDNMVKESIKQYLLHFLIFCQTHTHWGAKTNEFEHPCLLSERGQCLTCFHSLYWAVIMQGDFTDALQAQLKMKQILLGSAV